MKRKLLLGICLWLLAAGILLYIFREPIIDWLPIDQSGWETSESGEIRYLDEDGDPVSGWLTLGTGTYYFHPETCVMYTGWLELDEGRYYLDEDGARRTGIQTIDGSTCYLDENGLALTGWLEQSGVRMYLNDYGSPRTGWVEADGNRYYLNDAGILQTGWLELDGQHYYLDETGALQTGWLQLDDGRYYLAEDGIRRTGWVEADGNRYYLNESGILQTGWLELDGQKYYLKEDGAAARGKLVIDETTYYFTSTGANILLVNRWNLLPWTYEPVAVEEAVDGCWMESSCVEATRAMLTDLEEAVGVTGLLNGYRPYGTQYQGFYGKIKRMTQKGYSYTAAYNSVIQYFAFPGSSEHQLGMAVDIMGHSDRYYKNEDNEVFQWLKEHCWDYGFILRYPNEKSHITGIIYEPWHYRYVGIELAQELKDSGLCLEEYLDQLTNDGTTCGNPDARNQN